MTCRNMQEILKASVAVDGDTALAVDEALEDAIYVTYMEGKTDTESPLILSIMNCMTESTI